MKIQYGVRWGRPSVSTLPKEVVLRLQPSGCQWSNFQVIPRSEWSRSLDTRSICAMWFQVHRRLLRFSRSSSAMMNFGLPGCDICATLFDPKSTRLTVLLPIQSSSQTRTDVFQKNTHRAAVNCFYNIDPHSDQGHFAERRVPGQDNWNAAPLRRALSLSFWRCVRTYQVDFQKIKKKSIPSSCIYCCI